MNAPYEFADLEPENFVHVVTGGDGRHGVYLASVVSAGPHLMELRIIAGADSLYALTAGANVHIVHPNERWERARVTQISYAPELTVSLEPSPPVALLPGRGHERKFRRVTAQGLYGYATLITASAATRFRVQILDISAGGVSAMAHRELQRGDEVHLRLPQVTAEQALELPGRLVWSTPICGSWMAGIQFTHMDEGGLDYVQRFVFNLRWRAGASRSVSSL